LALLTFALTVGGASTIYYAIQSNLRAEVSAEHERDAIANEATANDRQEMLKDTLCVATYQQANALRLAGRPGWRKNALDLLTSAAELRRRTRDPNDKRVNLPSLADIRGEAVMALLRSDADPMGEINVGWSFDPVISHDGRIAAKPFLEMGKKFDLGGIEIIDLSSGKTVNRIEKVGDKDPKAATLKAMNSDGSLFACAPPDAGILIIEAKTGKTVVNLNDSNQKNTQVIRVRFSPDGRKVVAVCCGKMEARVMIWDIDRPLAPRVLAKQPLQDTDVYLAQPEEGLFGCLRFAPDSRRLSFLIPGGKGVRVLDLLFAPPMATDLPFPDVVTLADWHPRGNRLAILIQTGKNKRKVVLWDLVRKFNGPEFDHLFTAPAAAKFSSDGRWLAVSSASEPVVVFGADDGVERFKIEDAAGFIVNRLFWTSEGQLVTAGIMENLRSWRPSVDSQPVETIYRVKAAGGTASSRDGRWLALFTDSGAEVADPILDKHSEISPLADLAAISQVNRKRDTATLIDRATGKAIHSWPVTAAETSYMRFSPDGKQLVAHIIGGVLVWDIDSKKEILRRKPPPGAVLENWETCGFDVEGRLIGAYTRRFSGEPDEKTIPKKADKTSHPDEGAYIVWDLIADKQIANFGVAKIEGVPHLELVSSGRNLLVCPDIFHEEDSPAEQWEIYNIQTGRIRTKIPSFAIGGKQALPGRVSPDGRQIVVGYIDSDLEKGNSFADFSTGIHDLATGAQLLSLPAARTVASEAIDFSPDGDLLVRATGLGNAEVWDISMKELLFRWQPFDGKPIHDLAFTQKGDIVAIGVSSDHIPILRMGKLQPQLVNLNLGW
jgi:WD40 repeat protein